VCFFFGVFFLERKYCHMKQAMATSTDLEVCVDSSRPYGVLSLEGRKDL
jgi:hypothetical protein